MVAMAEDAVTTAEKEIGRHGEVASAVDYVVVVVVVVGEDQDEADKAAPI